MNSLARLVVCSASLTCLLVVILHLRREVGEYPSAHRGSEPFPGPLVEVFLKRQGMLQSRHVVAPFVTLDQSVRRKCKSLLTDLDR